MAISLIFVAVCCQLSGGVLGAPAASSGVASGAYASGNDVHTAPPSGAELGHEASHVKQQTQGKVADGSGTGAKPKIITTTTTTTTIAPDLDVCECFKYEVSCYARPPCGQCESDSCREVYCEDFAECPPPTTEPPFPKDYPSPPQAPGGAPQAPGGAPQKPGAPQAPGGAPKDPGAPQAPAGGAPPATGPQAPAPAPNPGTAPAKRWVSDTQMCWVKMCQSRREYAIEMMLTGSQEKASQADRKRK